MAQPGTGVVIIADMAIVCGTDFSQQSSHALTAAAHLAARMQMPLHVVHCLDLIEDAEEAGDASQALADWALQRLQRRASELRKTGARVEVHLASGPADEALCEFATRTAASLIVVAALGRRQADSWQLGSQADRTAQRSHVPVLVVRDAEPFAAWAADRRPLKIVVGVDFTASADAALRWVEGLRRFGPCQVIAAHVYWPLQEFERIGLRGRRSYRDPAPELLQSLERDLAARVAGLSGAGEIELRLLPHLGRAGDRLAYLGEEESADLVVVGSHARERLERWWEGSASRLVVQHAPTSVVCVPAPAHAPLRVAPRVRQVLVATDFSDTGNAAIPLAFSVVGDGGTVHLVHVEPVPPVESGAPADIFAPPGAGERVRERLASVLPGDAPPRIEVQRHVLFASDAAEAICQAAERLGVDLICLGTHGRTGLRKVVLGSVAQALLGKTRRPVLLARAPVV
jgi:nucleotide-binding universal stress UspA family protein